MRTLLAVTLLVLLAAGCSGPREAIEIHPLVGDWSYVVDSDQGIYTGILSFTLPGDGLQGAITSEGEDGAAPLSEIDYEAPQVSFAFQSPEYGLLRVTADLEDDVLDGSMHVAQYNVTIPFRATRVID